MPLDSIANNVIRELVDFLHAVAHVVLDPKTQVAQILQRPAQAAREADEKRSELLGLFHGSNDVG